MFLAEAVAVATDLPTWISSITGALSDMNVSNLITILVAALGITVPFFIFWFAYRLITRKATKGVKKGGV